jgi:hypothetical protein
MLIYKFQASVSPSKAARDAEKMFFAPISHLTNRKQGPGTQNPNPFSAIANPKIASLSHLLVLREAISIASGVPTLPKSRTNS